MYYTSLHIIMGPRSAGNPEPRPSRTSRAIIAILGLLLMAFSGRLAASYNPPRIPRTIGRPQFYRAWARKNRQQETCKECASEGDTQKENGQQRAQAASKKRKMKKNTH